MAKTTHPAFGLPDGVSRPRTVGSLREEDLKSQPDGADTVIWVVGNIKYASYANPMTPEAYNKINNKSAYPKDAGQNTISITLENAWLEKDIENKAPRPDKDLTPTEAVLRDSIYARNDDPQGTPYIRLESTVRNLDRHRQYLKYYQVNPNDSNEIWEITSDIHQFRELAQGTRVKVGVRFFYVPDRRKVGRGIQAVCVLDKELKWYTPGAPDASNVFTNKGLTVTAAPGAGQNQNVNATVRAGYGQTVQPGAQFTPMMQPAANQPAAQQDPNDFSLPALPQQAPGGYQSAPFNPPAAQQPQQPQQAQQAQQQMPPVQQPQQPQQQVPAYQQQTPPMPQNQVQQQVQPQQAQTPQTQQQTSPGDIDPWSVSGATPAFGDSNG